MVPDLTSVFGLRRAKGNIQSMPLLAFSSRPWGLFKEDLRTGPWGLARGGEQGGAKIVLRPTTKFWGSNGVLATRLCPILRCHLPSRGEGKLILKSWCIFLPENMHCKNITRRNMFASCGAVVSGSNLVIRVCASYYGPFRPFWKGCR